MDGARTITRLGNGWVSYFPFEEVEQCLPHPPSLIPFGQPLHPLPLGEASQPCNFHDEARLLRKFCREVHGIVLPGGDSFSPRAARGRRRLKVLVEVGHPTDYPLDLLLKAWRGTADREVLCIGIVFVHRRPRRNGLLFGIVSLVPGPLGKLSEQFPGLCRVLRLDTNLPCACLYPESRRACATGPKREHRLLVQCRGSCTRRRRGPVEPEVGERIDERRLADPFVGNKGDPRRQDAGGSRSRRSSASSSCCARWASSGKCVSPLR